MDMFIDVIHPADRDQVVFETGPQVQLRQFDLIAIHMIDPPDMAAVLTDDFQMFTDEADVHHGASPERVSDG